MYEGKKETSQGFWIPAFAGMTEMCLALIHASECIHAQISVNASITAPTPPKSMCAIKIRVIEFDPPSLKATEG